MACDVHGMGWDRPVVVYAVMPVCRSVVSPRAHISVCPCLPVSMSLCVQSTSDESVAHNLILSYERLVDPEQMGALFKVLCVASQKLTTPPPFHRTNNDEQHTGEQQQH